MDGDTLRFHPLPPPTDRELATLVASVRQKVAELLERRGLGDDGHDPVADDAPSLARRLGAAVQSRRAFGPRAGAPVLQLGRDPDAPWITSERPLHVHLEGFDLHAAVALAAEDRS